MNTREALRELLALVDDADVAPSSSHDQVEWDTVMSAAIHNARAALAADEKGESELVAALQEIARHAADYQRGQIASVARAAIAKAEGR